MANPSSAVWLTNHYPRKTYDNETTTSRCKAEYQEGG